MKHPKTIQWEKKLRRVMDEIDRQLEGKYGHLYPLHPARARKKRSGDPQADGLFRLSSPFSAGFGSDHGPGYIVKVELITLSDVPRGVRSRIEQEAAALLEDRLRKAFPRNHLEVKRDNGGVYRISGDLGLGDA